jgi:uncharacterized protein
MRRTVVCLALAVWFQWTGISFAGECGAPGFVAAENKQVLQWREERDGFFKTHSRSPLSQNEKESFKSLTYFAFDPRFVFCGPIERHILNVNNPHYYATFVTNTGTHKRYVRYGKFGFQFEGKDYALELYKSILSDQLFIPFKDKTNGKSTYEGGRYVDAEVLPGYRIVFDFNMAYFPSCAYNSKFVCALPPRENTLEIDIRAGERRAE